MSARRVLVVGDIAVDVVAVLSGPLAPGSDSPARIRHTGGGAGANVATWLARLGVPVTLVGRVGADFAGGEQLSALQDDGVQLAVAVDPGEPTGTVVVLVDSAGERSMAPDRGANRTLSAADLPRSLLATASHLHVSGYPLLEPRTTAVVLEAIGAARELGLSVSVDPASTLPLARFGPDRFLTATAGTDLLLPNEPEARLLTGIEEPESAAGALAERYPAVVVTRGAAGCTWAGPGGCGSLPSLATAVVDTTGAGDAFSAGVLQAWLTGAELRDCAAAGSRAAAEAVARTGSR